MGVNSDIPPSAPVGSSNLAMPHCRGIGKLSVTHFTEWPSARSVFVPLNCDTTILCGSGLDSSIGYILLSIPSIILAGEVSIVRVTSEPAIVIVLSMVTIFDP